MVIESSMAVAVYSNPDIVQVLRTTLLFGQLIAGLQLYPKTLDNHITGSNWQVCPASGVTRATWS